MDNHEWIVNYDKYPLSKHKWRNNLKILNFTKGAEIGSWTSDDFIRKLKITIAYNRYFVNKTKTRVLKNKLKIDLLGRM